VSRRGRTAIFLARECAFFLRVVVPFCRIASVILWLCRRLANVSAALTITRHSAAAAFNMGRRFIFRLTCNSIHFPASPRAPRIFAAAVGTETRIRLNFDKSEVFLLIFEIIFFSIFFFLNSKKFKI
jgi:hypothetical protein